MTFEVGYSLSRDEPTPAASINQTRPIAYRAKLLGRLFLLYEPMQITGMLGNAEYLSVEYKTRRLRNSWVRLLLLPASSTADAASYHP
jgi:hypothetical protein